MKGLSVHLKAPKDIIIHSHYRKSQMCFCWMLFTAVHLTCYVFVLFFHTLLLQDPIFLRECVVKFCRFVSSPKSVDCSAAASVVKLLIHRRSEEFNTLLESHLCYQGVLVNCHSRINVYCVHLTHLINNMCPHFHVRIIIMCLCCR